MDIKESYRVLELEIGASRAEVDAAYVRLVEHWHPDQAAARGPEATREAQRMVQAINDAYHTLAKISANTVRPSSPAPTGTAPAAGKTEGPATPAKPKLPAAPAEPAAPAKPKLPPLPTNQSAVGRLPPPPPPPPPGTWAARPASGTNTPASPTPPPSDATPPVNFTPPPRASATPPPAPGRAEGSATAPSPVLSGLERPAPGKKEKPPEKTSLFGDFRSQATGIYEKLFPEDSPRRRYGPIILVAALLVVLLLGKCAYSSLTRKPSGPPDPKTTGRLLVKSNVATATVEATRIQERGRDEPVNVSGTIGQTLSGLTPGSYTVTAHAEGWADQHGEVSLEAGHVTEIAFNFKSGSLRLDSDPAGATVRLGAAELGRTPLVIPNLPPGECELSLEYPTWPAVPFKATIAEGVEATGNVRLPYGKLTVTTTPPGATVMLRGRALGQTPLTVERFPAGTRKLTLQAKDFPPIELAVTMTDRGDVNIHPALGAGFPVLDPAALLRAIWIPDSDDKIAPPLEGVTGPFQSRNGVVKNLNRKRLFESWLRKRYTYTAVIKAYEPASGQVEFAEQPNDLSRYRIVAKLSAAARSDPEVTAQLVKGATFSLYGTLSAVEEPRWPFKVITFEFSPADPLR